MRIVKPNARSQTNRRRPELAVWPLRTEKDYLEMRAEADRLMLDAPEHGPLDDRLEVMLNLMEIYENRHHRLDTSQATPREMLRFLMEQRAMSDSDLGRVLGERTLGHKILSGRRELSKMHIKKLCQFFGVAAELFL